MNIDGPTFVPKTGFSTDLGQGCLRKLFFFKKKVEQIVRPGFLDKIRAKPTSK